MIGSTYYTSNTYIANSSGWFKFLCTVMGNAIDNGSSPTTPNNTDCIDSGPANFVNYLGQTISSISALNIDTKGATAQLLWSDVPGLISNVKISDDNQYIEFYISPQAIRQGNAVIGIEKDGKIMWSWQIWVTDWILNTENQTIGNGYPDIMPFAIGRCSAATYKYETRSITIRFTQETSNLTQEVTITQKDQTLIFGENAPFYQWGRKDPMLASDGLAETSKPNYGNNLFSIFPSTASQNLNEGILNPNIFYPTIGKPGSWFTPFNPQLWGNFSSAGGSDVKTIYDPSPIGYQVPSLSLIMNFISMGYKYENTPIPGYWFSPNNNTDYTIFMASNGMRNQGGNIGYMNSQQNIGFYWSNTNYYWTDTIAEQELVLNLIFPSTATHLPIYYQENPSASAINIISSIIASGNE